jgi:hypothetical protein
MRSVFDTLETISQKSDQLISFSHIPPQRKHTHRNSLEKFKMISLRSDKVRTIVLLILFLVAVQCLVGEGKVYNLNYNYINIWVPCKVYVFVIECSNRVFYKDAIDNGNLFLHHMYCVIGNYMTMLTLELHTIFSAAEIKNGRKSMQTSVIPIWDIWFKIWL